MLCSCLRIPNTTVIAKKNPDLFRIWKILNLLTLVGFSWEHISVNEWCVGTLALANLTQESFLIYWEWKHVAKAYTTDAATTTTTIEGAFVTNAVTAYSYYLQWHFSDTHKILLTPSQQCLLCILNSKLNVFKVYRETCLVGGGVVKRYDGKSNLVKRKTKVFSSCCFV